VVVEGAVRSGAINTAHWTTNLHRPVMGVPGPVSSAASTGVNQLIRLGKASMVTTAEDVIADLVNHAATAVGRAEEIDESFVPGPMRSTPREVPTPAAEVSALRR